MAQLCLLLLKILLFFVSLESLESANILFLLPVPSPSHRLWNNVLIEGLAEKGHNLTVLTVEYEPYSRQNVTYIYMENIYESLNEYTKTRSNFKTSYHTIKERHQLNNFISRKMFESKGLRQLANYPKTFKFHAVVFDFTLGQSLLAFLEYFEFPPLISVLPLSLPLSISTASSTQIHPSYIPHFSTTYTPTTLRNSMSKRVINMICFSFDWFYRKYVFMKNENRRVGKVFPGNKLNLEKLESSDLLLINREFAFDENVLNLPPNVKTVGYLHAIRNNEIPNDDVIQFVENSQKPIILFSMGNNILAKDSFGIERFYRILAAFRELKEFNFICQCPTEFIEHKIENVLFADWVQQNSLLGNFKLKLIVSHGGLLTIQEAIWHQKPLLGIPITSEEQRNIQRSIDLGFAEAVNVEHFTTNEIIIKIRMLIENTSYTENIKKRTELIDKFPYGPIERAVHWIEEVIKHNGLKHLKSEAQNLSFYEIYMIDIALITLIIIFIYTLIIQFHFLKMYFRKKEIDRMNKVLNETTKLKNE